MKQRKCYYSVMYTKELHECYFHGFFQSGDKEDGFNTVAVVENIKTGKVEEIDAYRITFVK